MNEEQTQTKRTAGPITILVLIAQKLFDGAVDGIGNRFKIIRTEVDLFLGAILLTIGIAGFNSDKFCDGNSADYLSCTRPSTYYYFSTFDQVLIVLGILLILLWVVSRRRT